MVEKFRDIGRRLAELGLDTHSTYWFFKSNRWIYELTMTRQIHDYVEGLLGPNFYLWGGAFFAKEAGDGTRVPFHQDAEYWGLHHADPAAVEENLPHSVVVWLACTDVDAENGALRVLPGWLPSLAIYRRAERHSVVPGAPQALIGARCPTLMSALLTPRTFCR